MKKISRLITTVLVLCMEFSTVAFAAETTSITEVNDAQAYFNDKAGEPGIQSREPAPPITSATITDILLDDSNGSHTFRYSGTSYNSPWNTVSTQVTFQVP